MTLLLLLTILQHSQQFPDRSFNVQ